MTVTINAVTSTGLVQTSDGSGVIKLQSNGTTTNAIAWVNFDGTTSPGTIKASYNTSSVTKNGTGDYTINFTNALTDANYAFSAIGRMGNGSGVSLIYLQTSYTKTTSAFRFGTVSNVGGTNAVNDSADAALIIFGN